MENLYSQYDKVELLEEYKSMLELSKRYDTVYCRDDDSQFIVNENLKSLYEEIQKREMEDNVMINDTQDLEVELNYLEEKLEDSTLHFDEAIDIQNRIKEIKNQIKGKVENNTNDIPDPSCLGCSGLRYESLCDSCPHKDDVIWH